MQKNEWGVKPGTQDNIMPVDAPMLSELECDLVNIFRSLPLETGKMAIRNLFELARQIHEK